MTGDNGILTRATEAKSKAEEAQEKEGIALAVVASQVGDNGYKELNQLDLQNEINNQFGLGIATVIDNYDGTFIIDFEARHRSYEVDTDKNIEFIGTFNNEAVARINDIYYETLQDAVNAAVVSTPTNVVLLKDITENITIAENKNIILNIKGYNISNAIDDIATILLNSNSDLTIEGNGKITSSGPNVINNFGNVRINGSIEISSTSSDKSTIYNRNYAVLEISNGVVKSEIWQPITNHGTTKIQGNAEIISNAYDSATITNTNGGYAIYNYNGTVNVENCNITGKTYY